ncbi:MAG: hypothetical protein GY853_02625 [PVC group bacterium]|nr:hypothetical protein [PVC group bacterium]
MRRLIIFAVISIIFISACKTEDDPYVALKSYDIPELIALIGSKKSKEVKFAQGALKRLEIEGAFAIEPQNTLDRIVCRTRWGQGEALKLKDQWIFRMVKPKVKRKGWARPPMGLREGTKVDAYGMFFYRYDEIRTNGTRVEYVFETSHAGYMVIVVKEGEIEAIF